MEIDITRTRRARPLDSGLEPLCGSTATVIASDATVGSGLPENVGLSTCSIRAGARTDSSQPASASSSVGTAFDSTGAKKT